MITIPSLIDGRLVGSATSAWFGCTAWALSAEIIKLEATAIRYCSLVRPRLSLMRSKTSFKKVESAPCLVPLPTSSLSKIAATETLELFSPSITAFTEENAPVNAPRYCMDGCEHRDKCPFYAPRFYLEHPKAVEDGLVYAVTDQADSEHVLKELKKGPYGRCVFHSDNTVVDHQTVDIEFENQVTASFLMTAFTNQCARRIRIMGTKGELKGDMEAGTIEIIDFVSGTNDLIQLHTPSKGHSGSDMSMMREFVRMVGEGKTGKTDASVSVASHLMALAAEEARIRKTVIDFEEYSAYETK